MADRAPITARRREMYVPERDNPEAMAMQAEVGRRYDEAMAPYREMKQAAIQRAYDEALRNTGDEDFARRTANAVAARMGRTETIASIAAPEAAIAGAGRTVGLARDALAGMRGRNAMTAEEMLPRALPAPRPGPSSPVGRGVSGEPIPGTSAERAPRITYEPYKPDVRSVPDELAVFEGEGGATADAVATARRMAAERAAAEQAFIERQMMEAESEGMGAAIGAGRRAPSRDVSPRYVGSQAATVPGRDVVPARTREGDLNALMDRYFGGGEGAAGGLPARGPTYYSNYPAAGPRLVGESRVTGPGGMTIEEWMAANNRPGMAGAGGGMPAWLKYALPTGAAVAGGTYLATGRGPSETGEPGYTGEAGRQMTEAMVPEPGYSGAGGQMLERALGITAPEVQGPPMPTRGDVLRNYGFNAFRQAAPAVVTGGGGGSAAAAPAEQPKQRGFLERIIGQPTQSKGGELIQDGRINWGSGESAADFVRASQAMQEMLKKGRTMEDIKGINPDLERASGGRAEDKSVHKALEIIHHLVKR